MNEADPRARVGLFGGTFNPIHVGHLRAAEEVGEALGLERVVFVPSAQPPHKRQREDDVIAPATERLAWVRAAVAGNPRFSVDAIEQARAGPSYSVDTLRAYAGEPGQARVVFVIGSDAFVDLGSWREPGALLSLANFAVMTRPPGPRGALVEWLPADLARHVELAPDGRSARHREAGTWIRTVEITALDVSSSDVRARLRAGRSVRYLLPDGVHDAVVASGLYVPQGAAGERRARRTRGDVHEEVR